MWMECLWWRGGGPASPDEIHFKCTNYLNEAQHEAGPVAAGACSVPWTTGAGRPGRGGGGERRRRRWCGERRGGGGGETRGREGLEEGQMRDGEVWEGEERSCGEREELRWRGR